MSDNMTPIIEELAREVEACYIPRYDMWQMDSETLKKFAESIIEECIAAHEDYYGGDIIGNVLKNHFGVPNK